MNRVFVVEVVGECVQAHCMSYRGNTGWQCDMDFGQDGMMICSNRMMTVTFRGVLHFGNLHSVKVDHDTSTGTRWDILDLVCLKGGPGREGKANVGENSNPFPFHVV